MTDLVYIQSQLLTKFQGDYTRTRRMIHFMSLLRDAMQGMAGLGVVFRVDVDGLDDIAPMAPGEHVSSLEAAIQQMQKATKHE